MAIVPSGHQLCSGPCGLVQPLDNFPWRTRQHDKRHNQCRTCLSALSRRQYARRRAQRRPLSDALKDQSVVTRFWSYVARGEPDACWPWTGPFSAQGYGWLRLDGCHQRASHIAYTLACGAIPLGLHVCHRCDNPPCVNPAHLWLGTRADNMRDCIAKKRGRWDKTPPLPKPAPKGRARGERHGRTHLTDDDVRAIRAASRQGVRFVELARQYGISGTQASQIAHGLFWKHVHEDGGALGHPLREI